VLALSTGLGDGVEEEARHGEVVGEESVWEATKPGKIEFRHGKWELYEGYWYFTFFKM
jgi:hypothetical protein